MTRQRRVERDAALALLITGFFGLGVVVVSRSGSYQSDLTALLVGRITSVDARQLLDTAVVAALSLAALGALHKELVLGAFDPDGARALGYPVGALDLLLNIVIALTVVAAVRAVGTVLVVAFVVTPVATARLLCRRVVPMMAVAVVVSALCGWWGLALSYEGSLHHGWRLASGATVVVTLTAAFVAVALGVGAARGVTRLLARPRQGWSPA